MEDEIKTKKEMTIEEIPIEKPQPGRSTFKDLPVRQLSELEDVVITSPANGHILKYNSTSGAWECEADESAGSYYFNLRADSGTVQQIDNTNVVDIAGGTNGIDSVGYMLGFLLAYLLVGGFVFDAIEKK